MYEIRHFVAHEGKDPYEEWYLKLRDRQARMAIDRRVDRMADGNFGDHKFCRDGVWELRVDINAGYRVYYAIAAGQIILLLCGGDKASQSRDIESASRRWQEWQERKRP